MREKLNERGLLRNAGQVDPRVPTYPRRNSGNSGAVLRAGTPVVWVKASDYDMSVAGTMSAFTDRMGVAWSITSGATGLIKAPDTINGKHAFMSAPGAAVSATCMESAAVTTGDVTVFFAGREVFWPGGTAFPTAQPVMLAGNTWWFDQNSTQDLRFNYKFANNATFNGNTSNVGGQVIVLAARGSAAIANLYQNGAQKGTNLVPTAGVANASVPILMGAGTDKVANPSWWFFGEVIVYGSYLPDIDRSAIEQYLMREYAP